MKKYQHGGDVWNGNPSEWLDFSANMNLLGRPKTIDDAINNAMDDIGYYPDIAMKSAKAGLADFLGMSENCVLVTSGGISALDLAISKTKPKRVVCFVPCFVEYERICGVNEIPFIPFPILEDGFKVKIDESKLEKILEKGDMLIVCNPVNPIGYSFEKTIMVRLIDIAKAANATVLVDEAFIAFCGKNSVIGEIENRENLIIAGSLTKIFCIPGIRLGYIACNAKTISALTKYQTPWAISCFASKICESLGDETKAFVKKSGEATKVARTRLKADLQKLGAYVLPSSANFLLVDLSDKNITAKQVQEKLKIQKILIRNCENYLSLNQHHMRVAVKSEGENRILISNLAAILKGEQT
jgi:threonine-phosphate decarboxylase